LLSTDDERTEYELLEMYGFSIEYPDTWEVEIGPRSTSTAGDVAFRTRGMRVFLSWGPLGEKRRQFENLDSLVKDSFTRMKKGPDVRKLEIVDTKETVVNGHRSIYNSARLTLGIGLMAMKTAKREVDALHFYCEQSQRFLALYTDGIGEGSLSHFPEIFLHMSSTVKCH
jgi:hypothetical protein